MRSAKNGNKGAKAGKDGKNVKPKHSEKKMPSQSVEESHYVARLLAEESEKRSMADVNNKEVRKRNREFFIKEIEPLLARG